MKISNINFGARITCRLLLIAALLVANFLPPGHAAGVDFPHNPVGQLLPGSGEGHADTEIHLPSMRFPIHMGPAYANSQVYGNGGYLGPDGSQCDEVNYSYPWWDNFCETRRWNMPRCPGGKGHQGQDIRPTTCEDGKHWTAAAEKGTITSIGTYTVYLQGDSGIRHRYMHMDHGRLEVKKGEKVKRGQKLGLISNNMGGTPTTIHLHYDMKSGGVYVSPYMSLVDAHERLLNSIFVSW